MKLLRRNGKREELFKPFENRFDYLKDELENVIERAWRTLDFTQPMLPYKQWQQQWPPLEVIEDELGVLIEIDVPGLGQKELEVEVEGKFLVVRGIVEEKKVEPPQKQVFRYERHVSNFERVIPIPEHLDPEKVEAKYEKGMLTIRLPRLPGKAPKKVLIQTV